MLRAVLLRRINPFDGLSNAREVWAWGMYDLANQAFQLLINTLLFSIYLKAVILGGSANAKTVWGGMVAVALVIVVVLSPGLGAYADARGIRKRLLVGSGIGAVLLTASLYLLGPGMMWPAAVLYVLAAVLVGLGENFLGSFLPFLSTPATVGRVSAVGWLMSYIGALLLLALTAIAVYVFRWHDPAKWRLLFVLAAVWFAAGILPSMFLLREPPAEDGGPRRARSLALFVESFGRLRGTMREAGRYRQLLRFLGVFFVYSLGTNTVVYFLGQIGDDFGFGIGRLIVLALLMAASAGASAVLAAQWQDRVGHRRMITVFLLAWVVSTLAMAVGALVKADVKWFWPIAAGLGFALGGIGTASRAAVGAFTPPGKSAEFFGLWGMTYKLAGVIGLIVFAVASAKLGQAASLFLLTAFFAAGLLLLPWVDVQEGMRAAHGEGTLDEKPRRSSSEAG
jgi:UMF1 family MFS transporter